MEATVSNLRERVFDLVNGICATGITPEVLESQVDAIMREVDADRAATIESLETSLRVRSDDLEKAESREAALVGAAQDAAIQLHTLAELYVGEEGRGEISDTIAKRIDDIVGGRVPGPLREQELVKALEGLLRHCEEQGWWLQSHAVKVMDAARAALAGERGE